MDKAERKIQLIEEAELGLKVENALEVLSGAFDEYEEDLIKDLKRHAWINAEKAREENVRRLQILDVVKGSLAIKVRKGQEAAKRLDNK